MTRPHGAAHGTPLPSVPASPPPHTKRLPAVRSDCSPALPHTPRIPHPVWNQGSCNFCTAHTVPSGMQYSCGTGSAEKRRPAYPAIFHPCSRRSALPVPQIHVPGSAASGARRSDRSVECPSRRFPPPSLPLKPHALRAVALTPLYIGSSRYLQAPMPSF